MEATNHIAPRRSDSHSSQRFSGLVLFLVPRDGRLREAASRKLSGGLPTPFVFAAVALRLNDWAAPVQKAAIQCASRCFPFTNRDIVALAATVLLIRQVSWKRWSGEREALDEAFGRSDVAEHLIGLLIRGNWSAPLRVDRFRPPF